MSSTFDLNLLPLAFQDGQEQPTLPGLHISTPPRRTARGRQSDRLFLYFVLVGTAQLTPSSQEQVLAKLAQLYYKTSGSVTAALRNVAESLNAMLLDRNVRSSGAEKQAIGVLCQAVIRENRLYIGISGPAHAYILTATGLKHYHESPDANRTLGVSKSVSIRYYQSELNPSDTLIMTYQPPAQWTPTLLGGLFGQGPESLRRKLAGYVGANFNAVLMQARPGTGKTFLLRPKEGVGAPPPIMEETREAASSEAEVPGGVQAQAGIISPAEEQQPILTPDSFHRDPAQEPVISPEGEQVIPPPPSNVIRNSFVEAVGKPSYAEAGISSQAPSFADQQVDYSVETSPPLKSPIQKLWIDALRKTDSIFNRIAKGLSGFFRQLVPQNLLPPLHPVVLAIIAIVIPIIVVGIASLVYFRSGKEGQYQSYFIQAEQLAVQADSQSGTMAGRQQWAEVLSYLDQAGKYGTTGEAETLRDQARQALDEMDGVIRLDFQNAITGGLPKTVQISHMVASNTELFVLDAYTGNILRSFSTTQGYELDDDFQCGPDYLGTEDGGILVDFAIFNQGGQGTTNILALDANGNLLLCSPGESPEELKLKSPPTGLGMLKGFTINQDNFYLLDPEKNAVWVYWNSNFEEAPEFFFGDEVPQMVDVIDIAVDKDDLYLLHGDGHVTLCTYSSLSVSPTECESPVPFLDSRPGRENRILIPETPVTQVYASQPPDPSLYFMEPARQAIYHLSFRTLTFHQQLAPSNNFTSSNGKVLPASAFALSMDGRVVFLAFGNQVYFADMP